MVKKKHLEGTFHRLSKILDILCTVLHCTSPPGYGQKSEVYITRTI